MQNFTLIIRATLLFLLSILSTISYGQTPCEGGFADGFPCSGFDLQDRLTEEDLGTSFVNDSWGWTDPEDNKEYALVCLRNGTAFIDISDPTDVVLLGTLPTHTSESTWRDVKVYQNHAFIVSEAGGHGMQVFDLTRLRTVASPPETFTEDAHYDGFGNAHNIVINPESGFAYGVGTQTFNGGPHFVDISDPLNPIAAGGYANNNYSHDAQVVTYNGPDSDYTGREILIGSNETLVAIVDITDKDNPVEISTITYPTIGYTHQGWFTEDQRFFLLGDETDELGFGFNTRTIIFDFNDLDNPELSFEYEGPTEAIDHNGYVLGDRFYLSNYRAGFRLIDIANIASGSMTEIGYFDTFIPNDDVGFGGGLWNVYPYFESGNIVLSGGGGFFLVKQNENLSVPSTDTAALEVSMYPNPATNQITISAQEPIGTVRVFNVLGQEILTASVASSGNIDTSTLQSGVYFVKTNATTQRLIIQ